MAVARRTQSETFRREQILAAARKVFREKGYDGTTVSNIVEEAGVAQGTFYLYFPSKKAAVLALAQMLTEEGAKRLAAVVDSKMTFEERLRMLVKVVFDFGRRNPDICRLIHMGTESLAHEVHQSKGALTMDKVVAEMFRQAAETGELEDMDPDIAARILGRLLPGCIQEAFVFNDGSDADQLEEVCTRIVVNAFTRRR